MGNGGFLAYLLPNPDFIPRTFPSLFVFLGKRGGEMQELLILSRRVKEIRVNTGVSQAAFAPTVGISVEELSLIERGKAKDVKLSTLRKIAAFAGLSVAALLAEPPR